MAYPSPMAELTPKQTRFCSEYLIDLNATAAAKRAGYSEATAHVQGPRLLANVSIASRIAELQEAAAHRNEVSLDEVITMLRKSYAEAKAAKQHGPAVRAAELLGKDVNVYVKYVGDWYLPTEERDIAETLITTYDVDVLSQQTDSGSPLDVATK